MAKQIDPMDAMTEALESAGPALMTFIGMIVVYWLTSQYFSGSARDQFLVLYFGGAGAVSIYMLQTAGVLQTAWESFVDLDDSSKYFCSIAAVASAYFLGRMLPGNAGSGSSSAPPKTSTVVIKYPKPDADPKKSFIAIGDQLIAESIQDLKDNYEAIPEQVEWVSKMLDYNVKGGKMNRGMGVVDVQRAFAAYRGRDLSADDVSRASVLGWCIEWLQAFFLVADDVMDDSETRRGQPCWFRVPSVKLIAINDSFILESLVFKILRRHFGHEAFYTEMVDLFHEVTYQTEMGQLLDLTSQPVDKPPDLTRFTLERYRMIVRYKTAFYTFYLPCAIGLIYAGVKDKGAFKLARDICCAIGEYFQIQDDFLDCYGDPELIGKVGTDIQDNKCSWLVVQALDRASVAQKKILVDNYGKHDAAKIAKVKALYKTLDLEKVFHDYEDEQYGVIKGLIAEVKGVPRGIFDMFIDKIHKRIK